MATAGPANPVSGALAILDVTDLNLEHCSTLLEVSASLMAINCTVCEHSPPSHLMHVHAKVVYYNNANSWTSHFNVYLECNPEHAKQFINEEWEKEMAAYGICDGSVNHGARS